MIKAPFFWDSDGIIARLCRLGLAPAGKLYGLGATLRRALASPQSVPGCHIICVGNATLGGVGKTPFCIMLFDALKGSDHKIAFLSKGYGGALKGPVRVDPDQHTAHDVGDEALLLARYGPVWASRDRLAGAKAAARSGVDVLIMDDGFQNTRLKKDVSILLVENKVRPNRHVFPAGPFREPMDSAVKRADIIALVDQQVGEGIQPELVKVLNGKPVVSVCVEPVQPPDLDRVIGFCGIANPDRFRRSLIDARYTVEEFIAFPDHYPLTENIMKKLVDDARAKNATLVTTEKDWMRIPGEWREEVFIFRVQMISPDLATVMSNILPSEVGSK